MRWLSDMVDDIFNEMIKHKRTVIHHLGSMSIYGDMELVVEYTDNSTSSHVNYKLDNRKLSCPINPSILDIVDVRDSKWLKYTVYKHIDRFEKNFN